MGPSAPSRQVAHLSELFSDCKVPEPAVTRGPALPGGLHLRLLLGHGMDALRW